MAASTSSQAASDHHVEGDVVFGLVGRRLGHSWSPQIHQALGSAPYSLIELEPGDVDAFVREGTWRGLNVTIPYKADAARLADERTSRVERLGVANTLVRGADGDILAENTDVLGFSYLLDRFCRASLGAPAASALAGTKVLVLGSGGASQAVQASLDEAGARTVVVSRHGDDNYGNLVERHADATLVVNTTPVGMFPDCPASPLGDEAMGALAAGGLQGVVDVVYNPRRTGICLQAERLGVPSESGLGMLVSQALYSSELFQGKRLDEGLVPEVEGSIRRQTESVILIGMPGVGKTTCGRALARLLGRPFLDLDDAFKLDVGVSPASYIRDRGEEAFRLRETEVAASHCARPGLVVACGGGIVTRPENYDLLHQNGTIVLLERPLDRLSSRGRPVSRSKGIERLARERGPLYRAWADVRVDCTGSAAGDARLVRGLLGL